MSTDTRSAIIESAWAVFSAAGTRQSTVLDIAHHAGLSRGTVYAHFANKAAILQAMADDVRTRLHAAMVDAMEHADSLEDQLGRAAEVLSQTRPMLNQLQQVFDGQDAAFFLSDPEGENLRATAEVFRPYIDRARTTGEVRPDLDSRVASEWFARILLSIYTTPSPYLDLDDPRAVRAMVGDHIVAGFGQRVRPPRTLPKEFHGLVGLQPDKQGNQTW